MKYFTSDLHFNHQKILDFCPWRVDFLDIPKDIVYRVKV
jgi:calcineurin-like phosphoesterase family protein